MNKHIEELIKLSTENPDMKIITMVSEEVCAGDEFAYWKGEISKIKVDYVYQPDEFVFCDEDDIYDYISTDLENEMGYEEETLEKETDRRFKELCEAKEIEKAIIIYIEV